MTEIQAPKEPEAADEVNDSEVKSLDDQKASDEVKPSDSQKSVDERNKEDLIKEQAPFGLSGRIFMRLGIAKTAQAAVLFSALLFIAGTFLPLLIMCINNGTAFPNSVVADAKIPLLGDFITLSRLLIAAPILILSDILSRPWLIKAIDNFRVNLIEPEEMTQFNALVDRVTTLRHSLVADAVILVIAFVSSPFNPTMMFAHEVPGWQLSAGGALTALSSAGWWNACISQPLFRFVVFSWFFRYLLWSYFLIRAARLKLRIIATHPDNSGGLSFIAVVQTKFCVAAFVMSSMICCVVAQAMVYGHATLQSFTNLAVVFVILILAFFICPLIVFTPMLIRARQTAIFEFGSLCHELNSLFARKWVATNTDRKPLIEAPDASTVTDLNTQFDLIQTMRPAIFDRQFVMIYVVMIGLPALPLVAMVIPVKDLIMQILKAVT